MTEIEIVKRDLIFRIAFDGFFDTRNNKTVLFYKNNDMVSFIIIFLSAKYGQRLILGEFGIISSDEFEEWRSQFVKGKVLTSKSSVRSSFMNFPHLVEIGYVKDLSPDAEWFVKLEMLFTFIKISKSDVYRIFGLNFFEMSKLDQISKLTRYLKSKFDSGRIE